MISIIASNLPDRKMGHTSLGSSHCHVAAPMTSCHGGRTASAVTGVAPERRLKLIQIVRWFVPRFMDGTCKNALECSPIECMMYV